jgi:integrase
MACIRKRRDRWVIDFYDQHGKRRWETMPEGSTKKGTRDRLREIEEKVKRRTYTPENKVPLFSQVAQDWLEFKKPKVRENTWDVYEGHVKNHFGEFNDHKVNRVTIADVEKWITKRELDGMNPATLKKILTTLSQILSFAVRRRYADFNPLREAEKPGGIRKKEMNILTPEQIRALIAKAKAPKYAFLFLLAAFTGGRQGEILGLKWSDIDWEKSQIRIQRTFNNGRWFEPKTEDSKRRIDVGPSIMNLLREWKVLCSGNGSDLVFPNSAGNPMNNHNLLNRHFYPALKAAGLPKVRFHDLRHTYASLLIEQGENVLYIADQMGHSKPTTTLNVYGHLMKKAHPEAATLLETTILGPRGGVLGELGRLSDKSSLQQERRALM